MDPTRQWIDQALLVTGIASYVTGALVLFAFFLFRTPILRTIGMPLAIVGCISQFGELGARWWMTGVWPLTNLYGSLSLFSAFAVLIFVAFAYKYELALIGGPVLALAGISRAISALLAYPILAACTAGIDVGQAEDVAKKRAIGFRVSAVDDRVRADDHVRPLFHLVISAPAVAVNS